MELLLSFIIGAFLALVVYVAFFQSPKIQSLENRDHEDLAEANKKIGDYENRILNYSSQLNALTDKYNSLGEEFHKLRNQKISSEVRMGQKSENLLPFLDTFPYRDDEIRGLFNPIDLIVFRDDEIVFVEVKTGSAQMSEKQRKIRDQIKNGKVRFEVHRMDQKGVRVK